MIAIKQHIKTIKMKPTSGYTIYGDAEKVWAYNYNDEVFEKYESVGRPPYVFSDLALAKKCLEECEDDEAYIFDNKNNVPVS